MQRSEDLVHLGAVALEVVGDHADSLLPFGRSHPPFKPRGVRTPDQSHLGRRAAPIRVPRMATAELAKNIVHAAPVAVEFGIRPGQIFCSGDDDHALTSGTVS